MTSTPPAGWYPDPAPDATGVRWYDGSGWTGHVRDQPATAAAPAVAPPPSLTAGFFRLSRVLQGLLRLNAAFALVEIGYFAWCISVLGRWADDPSTYSLSTAQLIDDLNAVDLRGTVVLTLVTGILFIIWLYRANRSDRVYQAALRRGAGWSIGGWFVPIGCLFLPFQQVRDVDRGALVARDADAPATGSALLGWWWAMFLCSNLFSVVVNAFTSSSRGGPGDALGALRDLRSADITQLIAAAFTVAAALLAVAVVRRITGLLHRP